VTTAREDREEYKMIPQIFNLQLSLCLCNSGKCQEEPLCDVSCA
jgi:hypothetical protein